MPARVVNGIPGRLAYRGREELCMSVLFLTKLDKLKPCCCAVSTISSHHQQVLGAGEVIRHQHLRHQTASLNHCHHVYSALSSPSKTPAASAQLAHTARCHPLPLLPLSLGDVLLRSSPSTSASCCWSRLYQSQIANPWRVPFNSIVSMSQHRCRLLSLSKWRKRATPLQTATFFIHLLLRGDAHNLK